MPGRVPLTRVPIHFQAKLMHPYHLRRHIYLCVTNDQAIFLDLRRQKYLGLSRSSAAALHGLVAGWPAPERGGMEGIDRDVDPLQMANELVSREILTCDRSRGKEATPDTLEPATTSLLESESEPPQIRAGDVLRFAVACVSAFLALRFSPLDSVVDRARSFHRRSAASAKSEGDVHRLSAVFRRLRPFLFTAKDACLFDSLALTHFLNRNGLAAHWVFGVRSAPFGAHSWVQHDGFVCNGTSDYVRAFTPILVI